MLSIIAKNMVSVIRQNGHIFRILISALPTMNQATREQYLNRVLLYVWDILEAYLTELIEKGVFRRDLNPAILTRTFVGMFLPFVLLDEILLVHNPVTLDYDQVVAQVITVFLRGALVEGAISNQ